MEIKKIRREGDQLKVTIPSKSGWRKGQYVKLELIPESEDTRTNAPTD